MRFLLKRVSLLLNERGSGSDLFQQPLFKVYVSIYIRSVHVHEHSCMISSIFFVELKIASV